MPELPEIASRAREMNQHLSAKTISGIEIFQPKSLNVPVDEFKTALTGAAIRGAAHHGKWIIVDTTRGWLLFNLGMGGELLLVTRASLPEKRRLIFDFSDGTCLAVNFWWFGYAHFARTGELDRHPMLARLGPNALDLSLEQFYALLVGQRSTVKSFLLDQSHIAGIGNAYIHDILFIARLHPQRLLSSLSSAEISSLYNAIHQGLEPSLAKGGAFYETDLLGQKGRFLLQDILVGYREGQPCPNCSTPIVKIKTGSTSSFICPTCQPKDLL
ncbi:MAG TPA: DNA-formamidopyrimidine glycosylase family protein [Anaerolineaceae bacterium]|nr:DNA-formamidopyrimidine glycosylase family protein [Anaerolineaceae bacterium]